MEDKGSGMSLSDFFDAPHGWERGAQRISEAFRGINPKTRRRNPVISPRCYESVYSMIRGIGEAAVRYRSVKNDDGRSYEPYAVLVHPEDRMKLQQAKAEVEGFNVVLEPEKAPTHICGLLLQAALFVYPGMFMVICEEDYRDLAKPENMA